MYKKAMGLLAMSLILTACVNTKNQTQESAVTVAPKPSASALSMEDRYYECVKIKSELKDGFFELGTSLLKDDNQLWAWFMLTKTIYEDRREYLSETSLALIDTYSSNFDRYQILQCEINFPVLKDPEVDANGQQQENWTPSAIV
jgi:hypothetical protein